MVEGRKDKIKNPRLLSEYARRGKGRMEIVRYEDSDSSKRSSRTLLQILTFTHMSQGPVINVKPARCALCWYMIITYHVQLETLMPIAQPNPDQHLVLAVW